MSILQKKDTGHWGFSRYDLTCGDVIEINVGPWLSGRIEHNGRDYIPLVGTDEVVMLLRPGLQVRFPQAHT